MNTVHHDHDHDHNQGHAQSPIDVHAHWYPRAFLDLISAHGARKEV